jgi:acetyltransferase-like isoleucine patch superfamily enzyme
MIDAWGPLEISDKSNWGFFNTVLTASHNSLPGRFGEVLFYPVVVHDLVWVTSGCMLFNCEIGEGAILAMGSVVRSRDVPPWCMVEGNPAKIIARFNHDEKRWVYQEPEELPRHGSRLH